MPYTRSTTLRLIRYGIIVILAALIIAYAVWRSLNYARGPMIQVTYPSDGASATSTTITVTGRALRVSSISMNGNPTFIDLSGNFHETITVFPGTNEITFNATDQFGRTTSKTLRIFGVEPFPSPHTSPTPSSFPLATSTASTTGI